MTYRPSADAEKAIETIMAIHGIKTKAKALNFAATHYLKHREINSELAEQLSETTSVLQTYSMATKSFIDEISKNPPSQ